MRDLTSHKVDELNRAIRVTAEEEFGLTCHRYRIAPEPDVPGPPGIDLRFHQGPVERDGGINGVSNEALLAVVIDRLQNEQRLPLPVREDAMALVKLEEAMHWLRSCAGRRPARGVVDF